MLRLHAYTAQYRLAGVQLNRREERRQGELRRWRDEPRASSLISVVGAGLAPAAIAGPTPRLRARPYKSDVGKHRIERRHSGLQRSGEHPPTR
jgi:hypothetical protein